MILSLFCYKSNDYFSISKGYRDIYDNMTSNKRYYALGGIGGWQKLPWKGLDEVVVSPAYGMDTTNQKIKHG